MSADTARLRDHLRDRRRSLAPAELDRAAQRVGQLLCALPELAASGHRGRLATYLPADGEIDPNHHLHALRGDGWTAHLPVIGADRSMTFVEWHEGDALRPNRFGVGEPTSGTALPATELDVVLVPCVAADEAGNRVGMGAGYYDRALTEVRDGRGERPVLIGIVHDEAVLEQLSPEPWDVPLDVVVSDRRVVRRSRR